jgi:APA family basic amino acid/polyamine antiporter
MSLKRVLGPIDSAWIVAGSMIGAGIFITPGLVAERLPGWVGPIAAWILGGVLALCGAAVYGELGVRLPRAGGDYRYLAVAFGPRWGFLNGWTALLLTFSAAAAAMAIVTVENLQAALPFSTPSWTPSWAAPLIVLVLTAANVRGARVGGRTTACLTAVPIAGLLVLFGFGLLSGEAVLQRPPAFGAGTGAWPLAFGSAMVLVYFTYSGWSSVAYLAEEVRDPERNLVRGLLGGTLFVTAVYVLFNAVLLVSLPAAALAGSTTAAAQAARMLLGSATERVLSLLVAIAVLSCANVTLMAGARIYYAMASDRLAPASLARVNAAGVPAAALWLGGGWTALLATSAAVEVMVNWSTLAILLLSSAGVASLFVLRRRDPASPAFRCPGYPATPLIYLIVSLAVAAVQGVREPLQSLYGVLIVAAGLPAYEIVHRMSSR